MKVGPSLVLVRDARVRQVHMADTKMLAEKVEAARQLVPAMLREVKPDVLASSILPTLLKPWPDGCRAAFGVGNDEESSRSLASPSKIRHMRSDYLPLLQEDQYVVCKSCRRTLLLDIFDEHIRVCASLPIALLQSDEMRASSPAGGGKANNRAKSASPPVPPGSRERPPSAGPSGQGVGGRPPKMPKRSTPPPGQQTGAKGAAERRLQFERGELSIDAVCGVVNGDKVCLHKLNCKYHNLAVKKLVPARPHSNPRPRPSPSPRPRPSPNPNSNQVCSRLYGGVACRQRRAL